VVVFFVVAVGAAVVLPRTVRVAGD